MTRLLPARADEALCGVSRHCTAKDRCYRSPAVRAIAIGCPPQDWTSADVREDGPCSVWVALTDEQVTTLLASTVAERH